MKVLLLKVGVKKFFYISEKIRRISLLLLHLRKSFPSQSVLSLEEFLQPKYFDYIVEAVRFLSGYKKGDDQTIEIEKPHKAIKYSHDLVKICSIQV